MVFIRHLISFRICRKFSRFCEKHSLNKLNLFKQYKLFKKFIHSASDFWSLNFWKTTLDCVCPSPQASHQAPNSGSPTLVEGQISGVTLHVSLCAFLSCLRVLAHSSLPIQLKIDFNSFRNLVGDPRSRPNIASRMYKHFFCPLSTIYKKRETMNVNFL